MKLKLRSSLFVTLSLFLALTACKKDSEPALSEEETNAQIQVQADDESQASLEMDASIVDVSMFLEYHPYFNGNNQVLAMGPCDATFEFDTDSDPKTITLTYNGEAECFDNKVRTGKVIISIPQNTSWKDTGAIATIKYENFKVVRKDDGKSVTLNGIKTFTNVSGGLVEDLYGYNDNARESITRASSSTGLTLKFDSSESRQWQVARKYTTTAVEYNLTTKIEGNHTEGNTTKIAEWGTNRFGNSFTTTIDAPIVISSECNDRVTGGTVTHKTSAFSVTATFGLDAQGIATTCPGEGSYYYKILATAGNKTFNAIVKY